MAILNTSGTEFNLETVAAVPDQSLAPSNLSVSEVKNDTPVDQNVEGGRVPRSDNSAANRAEGAAGVSTGDNGSSAEETPTYELDAARASRIKKRLADGATLNDDDSKYHEWYQANKRPRGRQPRTPTPEERKNDSPPKIDTATSQAPSQGARRKNPPPPTFHEADTWRTKYTGGVDNGRELLCTVAADGWHKALIAMSAQIRAAGLEPVTDVESPMVRNLLVCAVDDILPKYLKATPAIIGAYKTSLIITQRAVKAKAINAALEAKGRPARVVPVTPIKPVETPKPAPPPPPPVQAKEPEPEEMPKWQGGVNTSGHFIR